MIRVGELLFAASPPFIGSAPSIAGEPAYDVGGGVLFVSVFLPLLQSRFSSSALDAKLLPTGWVYGIIPPMKESDFV